MNLCIQFRPALWTLALSSLAAIGCSDASTNPDDIDRSAIAFSYAADSTDRNLDIYVMPPDGSAVRRVVTSEESEVLPDWSPDGQTLLFTRYSFATGKGGLWTVRADGTDLRELTGGLNSFGGRWSPDGQFIVFLSSSSPTISNLVVMRADGSDRHVVAGALVKDAYTAPSWSRDGRIAFNRYTDKGSLGIWTIKPDGSELTPLTIHEDYEPRWSPDGTKLVFETQLYLGSSVERSLFVVNADGSDRIQITRGSYDNGATWSPDGKWIIFDRSELVGFKSVCGMFRVPASGGVAVNIQPARTRGACQGSAWRSVPAR